MSAIPLTAVPSVSVTDWSSLKRFELEKRLESIITDIENEQKLIHRKVIFFIGDTFLENAKEKPWTTTLKCIFLATGVAACVPIGISSFACLNSFSIDELRHLVSSDFGQASTAVQIFSNVGQGVTYIEQEFELLLIPVCRGLYHQTICNKIESIYAEKIQQNPSLLKEEVDFLITKANQALSLWGGLPIDGSNVDMKTIQKNIDKEIDQALSCHNIVYLVGRELIPDAKSSWMGIVAKTMGTVFLGGITAATMYPLSVGAFACFAAFAVQSPNDLISPDLEKRTNAIGLYSNLGHALEYIAMGGILTQMTANIVLGGKYKKVAREVIGKIYDSSIQDSAFSKATSDLLLHRKQVVLARYA